jgi:hypothetical protein
VVLLVDFIAPQNTKKMKIVTGIAPVNIAVIKYCKFNLWRLLIDFFLLIITVSRGQKRRTFDSPNKRLDQRYLVDGLYVRQNHSDGKPHLHREQILVE